MLLLLFGHALVSAMRGKSCTKIPDAIWRRHL